MERIRYIKYLLIDLEVLHRPISERTLNIVIEEKPTFIPNVGMTLGRRDIFDSNAPWLVSAVIIDKISVTVLLCNWNLYRPENTELYVGLDTFMIGVLKEDLILRPVMPNKMAEVGGFGWGFDGWGPSNLGRVLLREATGLNTESKDIISQDDANNFEGRFIQPLTQNKPFVLQGRELRLWAKEKIPSYKP